MSNKYNKLSLHSSNKLLILIEIIVATKYNVAWCSISFPLFSLVEDCYISPQVLLTSVPKEKPLYDAILFKSYVPCFFLCASFRNHCVSGW